MLNGANVGAVTEEVGGEGVAKGVGSDHVSNPRTRHVRFQMPLYIPRRDAVQFILSTIHKECLFHIVSCVQIITHRRLCSRGDEDDAHLLAFAAHRNLIAGEVDV